MPQGSVLGPTLFLCYINDLPDLLSCKVSLYADDTLLYQTVSNNKDAEVFQSDINAVYEWSLKWKMPFNEKKMSGDKLWKSDAHIPLQTGYLMS